MDLTVYTITIDCEDPVRLAGFWAAALGYTTAYATAEEVAIESADDAVPALLFVRTPGRKAGKNRIHLDLNTGDQQGAVRRLLELGATSADIGQGEVPWVVLRDPEGNEFCVLTPRG